MIIQNHVVPTIICLILVGITVSVYNYQLSRTNIKPDWEKIVERRSDLKNRHYSVLDAEKILGRKGFYEVFDSMGYLLYSSSPNRKVHFTAAELSLMNMVNERVEVEVKTCNSWSYNEYYLITRTLHSGNDKPKYSTYTIVDSELKIVDGYYNDEWDQLTQGQFNVISQNVLENYTVNRYTYEANTYNDLYSVVFFSYVAPEEELRQMKRSLYKSVGVILAIYSILFLAAIGWTYKTVNKPLKILDVAFNQYEAGQIMNLEYSGLAEFEKIMKSFSEMAGRLARSEARRRQMRIEQNKMIANIAHDIRTPVTVILGYARAILDNMMPEQEQRSYVESIYQKSARLSETVDTFAAYSKLEHPEFKLEQKRQNFCEMLRVYFADKYSEFEVEGFGFEAYIPEDVIICDIDTFQFLRVLENLIGNSIRYNQKGTTIYVEVERINQMAILHVGDNGRGIDEEYMETIFEPFVVGDDSRGKGQGSGLGLALSKKIVEEHGGTIELMKKPQVGWSIEFIICIPEVI